MWGSSFPQAGVPVWSGLLAMALEDLEGLRGKGWQRPRGPQHLNTQNSALPALGRLGLPQIPFPGSQGSVFREIGAPAASPFIFTWEVKEPFHPTDPSCVPGQARGSHPGHDSGCVGRPEGSRGGRRAAFTRSSGFGGPGDGSCEVGLGLWGIR